MGLAERLRQLPVLRIFPGEFWLGSLHGACCSLGSVLARAASVLWSPDEYFTK
jgi:hypothetical protein